MNKPKRQRNALSEILYSPRKDMNAMMNPLARLVRTVFADLNIRPNRFFMMLNQYLNDPLNGLHTPEKRSSERGNIQKEFAKNQITFKTLVKILRVLNAKRVGITLTLEWHDGTVTQHSEFTDVMSSSEADIMNALTTVNEEKIIRSSKRKSKSNLKAFHDMLDDDTEPVALWQDPEDDNYEDDD